PFVAGLLPMLDSELAYPTSEPIRALQKLPPEGRMLSVNPSLFAPELATYYGIPDVRGYDVLYPRRVAALLHALAGLPAAAADAWEDGAEGGPARESPGSADGRDEPRAGSPLDLLGLMSVRALAGYAGPAGSLPIHRFALDPDPCAWPYAIAMNPRF